MSRFQFVADNSATFEVKRLCELVEIERSSYYAWVKAAPAREARAAADAALVGRAIDEIATAARGGTPRVALQQLGRLVPEFEHAPEGTVATR